MNGFSLEDLRSLRVEALRSEPLVVESTASISELIGALKRHNAYEVFIHDRRKISMITTREILKASDISRMKVSTLMFPPPKLSPNDSVGRAAILMTNYRLRSLPIMERATFEGVITAQSLCKSLIKVKAVKNFRVSAIMSRKLITINKDDSVSKASNKMIKYGIDHLPVLDSGELCGMLTSSHILTSFIPKESLEMGARIGEFSRQSDIKVESLMDRKVSTCDVRDSALFILKEMVDSRRTYTIVKLWDELHGIVTLRDYVRFLIEPEEMDVPAYIVGLPNDPFEAESARIKFMRVARTLHKTHRGVQEIRANIKTTKDYSDRDRRRYEVDVSIKTPKKIYTYSEAGWDLPSIFDSLSDKLKRLLRKRGTRKRKTRIRGLI